MNKNSLKQRPPVPKPPVQTKARVSLLRNLTPELYDRPHQKVCSTNYSKGELYENIWLWLASLMTL